MLFGSKWTSSFALNNYFTSVGGSKQSIYLESADYSVLNGYMHMHVGAR